MTTRPKSNQKWRPRATTSSTRGQTQWLIQSPNKHKLLKNPSQLVKSPSTSSTQALLIQNINTKHPSTAKNRPPGQKSSRNRLKFQDRLNLMYKAGGSRNKVGASIGDKPKLPTYSSSNSNPRVQKGAPQLLSTRNSVLLQNSLASFPKNGSGLLHKAFKII